MMIEPERNELRPGGNPHTDYGASMYCGNNSILRKGYMMYCGIRNEHMMSDEEPLEAIPDPEFYYVNEFR